MLGSAVSASTPRGFHPNLHMGVPAVPLRHRQVWLAPLGRPYTAVGMRRALAPAIDSSRSLASALWTLRFLMLADVSSNRRVPLRVIP
jgi:hypothetical protein